jgi:hypothetical protein
MSLRRLLGIAAKGRYCKDCRYFKPHQKIEDPHYGDCTKASKKIDPIDGSIDYRNVDFARIDCLGWWWEPKKEKNKEELGY